MRKNFKESMSAIKTLALILLILFKYNEVFAQWNTDPLINTPVCTTQNSSELMPQLVPDQLGGAFVTWQSMTMDMDSSAIYFQHLSSTGMKLLGDDGVKISGSDALSLTPLMVTDLNGGAIIGWIKQENGILKHFVQKVTANGVKLWGSEGVSVCPGSNVTGYYYQMITDGRGGAIFLWDDNGGGPNPNRIISQRIDGLGNRLWTDNGLQVTPLFAFPSSFDAVVDTTGGMVLTWYLTTSLQARNDIFVQHVTGQGQLLWGADGKNIANANKDQLYSKIIKDKNENYIVIWQDFQKDPAYSQFFGKRILTDGTLQWGLDGALLADSVVAGSTVGKIVPDTSGGAILAWVDDFDPTSNNDHDNQLYSVHFDSTGSIIASKQPVMHWVDIGTPADFRMVADNKNGSYVSWVNSQDGTQLTYDVYAQHILPTGAREFADSGKAICLAASLQYYVQIIFDTISDRPIMVWTDARSGTSYDLYGATIGENGTLPVRWLDVDARLINDQVLIEWTTSDEINNKGFVIERSANGARYDSIGFVIATAGHELYHYSFTDQHPLTGISYYRLKQVDIDQHYEFSKTMRVERIAATRIVVYPNPAKAVFRIDGVKASEVLIIYDQLGRQLKAIRVMQDGTMNIDVSGLSKGVYYLVIKDKLAATKFIKE